jgi:hypothetical protein
MLYAIQCLDDYAQWQTEDGMFDIREDAETAIRVHCDEAELPMHYYRVVEVAQ